MKNHYTAAEIDEAAEIASSLETALFHLRSALSCIQAFDYHEHKDILSMLIDELLVLKRDADKIVSAGRAAQDDEIMEGYYADA